MTEKTQKETDDTLVAEMLGKNWHCGDCEHVYSEAELRSLVSGNQNCPSCKKFQS